MSRTRTVPPQHVFSTLCCLSPSQVENDTPTIRQHPTIRYTENSSRLGRWPQKRRYTFCRRLPIFDWVLYLTTEMYSSAHIVPRVSTIRYKQPGRLCRRDVWLVLHHVASAYIPGYSTIASFSWSWTPFHSIEGRKWSCVQFRRTWLGLQKFWSVNCRAGLGIAHKRNRSCLNLQRTKVQQAGSWTAWSLRAFELQTIHNHLHLPSSPIHYASPKLRPLGPGTSIPSIYLSMARNHS